MNQTVFIRPGTRPTPDQFNTALEANHLHTLFPPRSMWKRVRTGEIIRVSRVNGTTVYFTNGRKNMQKDAQYFRREFVSHL